MTLSVMGLYQYDQTIFNALVLPDGIDRQTLAANILVECAELEVLITDPAILKESLAYWSRAQLPIWQKLYNTTQLTYNPIWNKDGVITETEERDLQRRANRTNETLSNANSTTIGKVSAFNSSAFENAEQRTSSATGGDSETGTETGSDTGTITRTRTEQGNIGITTTQQMIKEEREVSNFSIYAYIVQSFKSMYCLGVY